ncbi:MAG: relaxase domain-containing protein [Acidimicrobiia bacterium]|nr:relaxase domain-containing protein [Acidimicrobiia bacterium]
MLSIGKLGQGQEAYYDETVAEGAEEYYVRHGEAPGRWMGRSAARLELVGEVDGGDLASLLGHLDPRTGKPLTLGRSAPKVAGFDLTVRRAVAGVKASYRAGRRRVYRPWIPEPGMWAQWDWGQGQRVEGRATNLFCARLAWSRTRVIVPTWDRTLPTLIGCLDRAMRAFGGCPTY